jgi:hypothetical protein
MITPAAPDLLASSDSAQRQPDPFVPPIAAEQDHHFAGSAQEQQLDPAVFLAAKQDDHSAAANLRFFSPDTQ